MIIKIISATDDSLIKRKFDLGDVAIGDTVTLDEISFEITNLSLFNGIIVFSSPNFIVRGRIEEA